MPLIWSLWVISFSDNRTNFTQGGVNIVTLEEDSTPEEMVTAEGRVGFIGWSGLGGSIFQWHPELKIGFAFVPSCLHWFDFANLRGAKLQKLVLECVKKQSTIWNLFLISIIACVFLHYLFIH